MPTPAGPVFYKPGAAGMEDSYRFLANVLTGSPDRALDLSAGVGLVSLRLKKLGAEVLAIEDKKSSCRALQKTAESAGIKAACSLPWEIDAGQFDLATIRLEAERGNEWVHQQLLAAAKSLKPDGNLWISGSKKAGFTRYLQWSEELLGSKAKIFKQGDLRAATLTKKSTTGDAAAEPEFTIIRDNLRGHELSFYTLPGVFSATEIDPASKLLLKYLPRSLQGSRILDIGAGYGAISLPLAVEGASVTLLEQSLAAVKSAKASFASAGLEASIHHSDVDESLRANDYFDIVVTNPPFHVGGGIVLEVAEAFVAAAFNHLRPGGQFYLVANPFLKYERWMSDLFGNVQILHSGRYKVLQSSKP
ncbi:MAG: methyltransferase [Chloroflexi bacterium]|nr:methyltransferase [Chloroflexota bacterium]